MEITAFLVVQIIDVAQFIHSILTKLHEFPTIACACHLINHLFASHLCWPG